MYDTQLTLVSLVRKNCVLLHFDGNIRSICGDENFMPGLTAFCKFNGTRFFNFAIKSRRSRGRREGFDRSQPVVAITNIETKSTARRHERNIDELELISPDGRWVVIMIGKRNHANIEYTVARDFDHVEHGVEEATDCYQLSRCEFLRDSWKLWFTRLRRTRLHVRVEQSCSAAQGDSPPAWRELCFHFRSMMIHGDRRPSARCRCARAYAKLCIYFCERTTDESSYITYVSIRRCWFYMSRYI